MPRPPDSNEETDASADLTALDGQLARDFAVEVLTQLRSAGYQALWAGGCVRDHLRNVSPQDFDIATNATPAQVRALFGKRRTLAVGEQFGVVIVWGRRKRADGTTVQQQVEVATFRKDAHYEDGRRPTSVEFSTPEEDAQRRDFTINGLFFDPIHDEVIDYVDGQRDLAGQLVRAIGNPDDRFNEDKLRMLRAVRFAATLDFQLDAKTQAAITARPEELTIVSAERIAAELRKTLVDKNRARGVALLRETGLLSVIFPETNSKPFEHNWEQTLGGLRAIAAPTFADCLALLFRSVDVDCSVAAAALTHAARRQKFTNRETQLAAWLIANEKTIDHADTAYWPTVQRLLIHADVEHLLGVVTAGGATRLPAEHAGVAFCRAKLSLPARQWNPPPLLDGNDLLQHGVPRGAMLGRILEAVRDAQLLGECQSLEAALALADEMVAGN